MLTASRLVVSGARRAVVLAGQRQGAVQIIRRTSVRGIQSIAQTDRASSFILFQSFNFLNRWIIGYHYSFIVFYWDQTRS